MLKCKGFNRCCGSLERIGRLETSLKVKAGTLLLKHTKAVL